LTDPPTADGTAALWDGCTVKLVLGHDLKNP
jgi:hypothetical protein